MNHYIGIDIGGTNIAVGIVNEKGKLLKKQSIKTESQNGYNSVIGVIAEFVEALVNESGLDNIAGVGVGCPGGCNKDLGIVEAANNLKWYNVPLADDLAELTGYSVKIDNDANAAAYGEFVAGVAKGSNSAVVITLGTGVGAGIIIDRKLFYGSNFVGGEIGHMVIQEGGVACNCGRKGCFEVYSSATGLIRMTKEAIEQNPASKMSEIAEKMGKVSARTAWDAAKQHDKIAQQVVDMYIGYLACGITNVINIFQPDIVCIGGGVCNEGDNLLIPLKNRVAGQVFSRDSAKNSEIAICSLGNDAGIIGAAMLGAAI